MVSVGMDRTVLFEPATGQQPYSFAGAPAFDRQIRAFGREGQRKLQELRVAIVGLGGTGSLVAQQLAHLGIRDFLLIDPDTIEATNLNRVAGATAADIGQLKVAVAERYIRTLDAAIAVQSLSADVVRQATALSLVSTDIIFGCTDLHGSRAVLQQIAYQYFVPCVDMGSVIARSSGDPLKIFGRVQLLAPGLPCLTCTGLLDAHEVRRDMMNEFERKADPYWIGAREPAPSVISLNGTVASLAVTMLLSMVAGVPMKGRSLLYNLGSSTLRCIGGAPTPGCFMCSRAGALGRGSTQPLFARRD